MKKITILLVGSLLATLTFAQQFPLQSQYQFNYSSINPAAVGENEYYSTRASFRRQWVGLTDNPIATQLFAVTKGFGNNGLGITVFSDQTGGAFNKSGMAVSYSHKVSFASSDLFFGVSAGGAKINLENINDPALINTDDMIAEATFGAYYMIKDFKIGISIPGLLNTNMEISNSNENTLYSHFYSMISYNYRLNEEWEVYPSILVKTTANHNQIDGNINFKLKNKLWFGASYRQDFGPTIYIGIDFARLFSVYSHDISTNEASSYSNGSHEFTLGYDFIPEKDIEVQEEARIKVTDRDSDGVEDVDDLCPDIPGDILANGCPDFDKDGIPDNYDLCPHLFGSKENQGCPELTSEEEDILTKALGDLRFDFDKDEIKYSSYNTLTDLTVLMHKNPSMYLIIEGHTSSEGTSEYNLSLSARRTKTVQKFFIERGLDKNRMVIDFYGEDNPLNTNTTESERAENRRVEFDIKYHLYDRTTADEMKEEYDNLLNNVEEDLYSNQTIEEKIIEDVVIEEEIIEDVVIEEEIIEEEFIEDEIIEEETIEEDSSSNNVVEKKVEKRELEDNEQVVARFSVTFDSIIFHNSEEEETLSETEEATDEDYLLVVHVLNKVENAINFISNSEEDFNFKYIEGRYYVYVFSSPYREDVEMFRSAYNKECWIKNPIK
jgi:type IX secretion system PorP/SprF family membrane protein